MIPVGYMYKRVAKKDEWLKAEAVADIFSLSKCISKNFADYIHYWKHNGYWLFNSPDVIEGIAREENIDLSGTTLFYYEAYEYEFDENSREWAVFTPEAFATDIQVPTEKHLEGFDIATFWLRTSPEHSPLSCNALATTIPVNEHCLIRTFEEAKEALESGAFDNSEPGPYRIFAVYTLGSDPKTHSAGRAQDAAQAGESKL